MDFKNYLNSLLPSFNKSRIREDINTTSDELKRCVIPLLKSASDALGERDFSSEYAKLFNVMYKEQMGLPSHKNFFVALLLLNEQMLTNLDTIEKMVDHYYAADVLRDALSVARVNILQYIETVGFIARYSRRIVNVVLACEVNIAKQRPEFDDLLPGEMQWMTENRSTFIQAASSMMHKKSELESKLAKMPDVLVTEESSETLAATQGQSVIDPFKFGLIPVRLNPIYHVRIVIAEYQASRYRAAEAERKMVEFRIMQLEQMNNGQADPKLEQQIEYNTGRLQDLNKKLLDMESNYD